MLGIVLLFAGRLSAQDVKTDYGHNADFTQYKTYSWEHVQTNDPLFVGLIKSAVNAALAAKRWTQLDSGGEISIIAIRTTQDQQILNTFYDDFGGGWGGRRLGDGAAYDHTVANYRQTVLTSFQQVEDNIAGLRILEHEAAVQEKAVIAAQKYLDLANTRYTGGVTSYLEVATAETAALTDEVAAVNILGRRMVDAVSLVQALGGGWDRASSPDRPECCGKLTSQLN